MKAIYVAEATVVRLGDDWQAPGLQARAGDLPLKNSVAHETNAVRIGDRHGTLENPRLLQPSGAGHFSVSIQRGPRAEDRVRAVLTARMDDGYAGTDRTASYNELAIAVHERRVSDFDSGDVSD